MDKKKYNIKRVRERRIMSKKKPITHDLFGVDECDFCQGTGEVKCKEDENVTEDCEMCKGTGVDT
mgnify:FL=1|jgi:DnaJ-class molecular chaperone